MRRWRNLVAALKNIFSALGATWQRPRQLQGPLVILITGASVGIGLEIAKLLKDTPHILVLTARAQSLRRFTELGFVENKRLILRALDVTSASERKALIDEIEAKFQSIDVLINNAGLSFRGVVEHGTDAEIEAQMDVNYTAPMSLIRLVLPGMRKKKQGRIINVSSVGGMTAMPTMSAYSASKFALEGASEALWYEVRPWGIGVTLVQPGFINSDGFKKVVFTEEGKTSLSDPNDPYHRHYLNMERFVERLMNFTWSTSASVAKAIVRTVHQADPPLRISGTMDAWLFALIRRWLPRGIYHRLLYAGLPRVWSWGPRRPPS